MRHRPVVRDARDRPALQPFDLKQLPFLLCCCLEPIARQLLLNLYRVSDDAVRVIVMSTFRIREAAELLGVSDDTVRRWAEVGRIATTIDDSGRQVIEGQVLARFAEESASADGGGATRVVVAESLRNRFTGLVTRVVKDTVMAQVEIQSGPHRFVSLLSREAADDLGLEPGVLAVAAVKATNVSVEIPQNR
jgi:molybdopterin-binding protein